MIMTMSPEMTESLGALRKRVYAIIVEVHQHPEQDIELTGFKGLKSFWV